MTDWGVQAIAVDEARLDEAKARVEAALRAKGVSEPTITVDRVPYPEWTHRSLEHIDCPVSAWLDEHQYDSITECQGRFPDCPDEHWGTVPPHWEINGFGEGA